MNKTAAASASVPPSARAAGKRRKDDIAQVTADELEPWIDRCVVMAARARQLANHFRSCDYPDEGAYIDAHWDASVASPTQQYQRLQTKARWAIASAKDGRPAYDRVIKIFKALKKEVDAVVGDSK